MVKDEHIRFILPSCGLFGLYLGGFLGLLAFPMVTSSESELLLFVFSACGAIIAGAAALLGAQIALWPVGRAVQINHMVKAWLLAWPLCWLIVQVAGRWELAAVFLQNGLLWTAGFLSARRDERGAADS